MRDAGPTLLEGLHCEMWIESVAIGVVRIAIAGRDIGEFGVRPLREVEQRLGSVGKATLFIDAVAAEGATIQVSQDWALWLQRNRHRLAAVHMLHRSPYVRVTAGFVRRFAELENIMHLHEDRQAFHSEMARHIGAPQ